jgi:undecaprenyl-diphosphatase
VGGGSRRPAYPFGKWFRGSSAFALVLTRFGGTRSSTLHARRWRLTSDSVELGLLVGGLSLLLLILAFAGLTGLVVDGDTRHFDERLLRALRDPANPSHPIGPAWLESAALDFTALGSGFVLGLVVLAIVGFLLLQGTHRTALFVLVATCGGGAANSLLKALFQRPRPEVVPHLRDVFSLSFPSGHAMTSAAVYLTLGALLMRITERRATKVYCMAMAMLVTVIVGSTRVYLGVHYPTDVLAGWIAGMSWALLCWIVERALEGRTRLARERQLMR